MHSTPIPRVKIEPALPYAFLAVAAMLAYSNVYNNTFLFDDEFLLVKNSFLHSWSHLGDVFRTNSTAGFGGTDSFYRPLQIFLYQLFTQLFSFAPSVFHALNVALHAGNAMLVLALATRLGFRRGPALLAALIWAVHPVHTEAVTYMSATADPLHVLFGLGALLAWENGNIRRQSAAVGLFILALLAKETAVIFPALLLLVLYFKNREGGWRQYLATWPLWLIAGLYVAARATILNFNHDFDFYKEQNIYTQYFPARVFTFLATLPDYFRILLVPYDLHIERRFPIYVQFLFAPVLFGVAIVLAALLASVKNFLHPENRAMRALAFGLLWFFVAYFPCSGVVIPVNALFLEHWMYLPSIGLFLGAGEALGTLLHKHDGAKATMAGLAAVGALMLGALTWMQNSTWQDPISLYTHILQFEEGSARMHNNLAMAYDDAGADDLALVHYQKAISLEDTYPQTHYNLARLLLKTGDMNGGVTELNRALKIDPKFHQATELLEKLSGGAKTPD